MPKELAFRNEQIKQMEPCLDPELIIVFFCERATFATSELILYVDFVTVYLDTI